MTDAPIGGWTEPQFDAVRTAFEANFSEHGDVGAAVCVYLNGESVVDLWGGWYSDDHEREWDRNTLVNVFSTTKGLAAFCAHRLIEQGLLDVDQPVAHYWPEFAAAGKESIPVRMLLNHQAGMAAVRRPLVMEDMYSWETMTAALAEQEPWWTPGERHGYHALTYGWLVGEVVRRIDGRSLGTYWREEFAAPLGLDAHIGTGPEYDGRISTLLNAPVDPDAPDLIEAFGGPDSVGAAAFSNPPIAGPDNENITGPVAAGAPPKSPLPTATRRRGRWPGCTAARPTAARSTASTCSIRTRSRTPSSSSRTAPTPACRSRRASASAGC